MEENIENAVSTQKKLPPTHDPGWNDPPTWLSSSAGRNPSTGTPTKRLMNKRVAFPLNYKPTDSSTTVSNASMPPMSMPPSVGSTTMTSQKIQDSGTDLEIDKVEALKDTLDNFCQTMERLNSGKKDEIKKRLDRMEIMWNEDKLNSVVHRSLLEISKALTEGEVEKADQLHISLMMSNASVCSTWMPGIRQIITEMRIANA